MMRRNKRRLVSAIAVGASLLSAVGGYTQTIPNPSFETDTFTVFPGYVSGNTAITDWTVSNPDRVGLNPGGGSPFADNGTIPAGNNVAFIQSDPSGALPSTLSTLITGLEVDAKYTLSFRANARNGQWPNLKVSVDSQEILAVKVGSVGGANAYWNVACEFTATSMESALILLNDAAGDNTLVVDDFQIAPSTGKWTVAQWTGDVDSGIDPNFLYTHAYSFVSAANPVINGVGFKGMMYGNPSVPGKFTTTVLGNIYANDAGNNITGASAWLANDFIYGGNVPAGTNEAVYLEGLTPGKEYVVTLFSVAFGGPSVDARTGTFSVGEDRVTINQQKFGDNNGMTVSYRYTADANGTAAIKVSPLQATGLSLHFCGFCNREAESRDFAPVITLQPQGKTVVEGQSGILRVVANSVPAPAFQWRRNGQNIDGATEAVFVLPTAAGQTAGDYDVVVSNAQGVTTSAVAKVMTVAGIALENSSFEAESFTFGSGYISDNVSITGWTAENDMLAGLNPAETSPFANNGTIPDGNNVAFIQAPNSLSTTLSGLTVGSTYKITLRANARTNQSPTLKILVSDEAMQQELLAVAIQPALGGHPYFYVACEFTATADTETLTLRNDASGDQTVLIDEVNVTLVEGTWTIAQWNTDADSGIDGNYPYTHAYSFGSAASGMVNGVQFTGVAGANPAVSNIFYTTWFPNAFTDNDANNISGAAKVIANNFVYGGDVPPAYFEGITLQGLTPGVEYIMTVYLVGWETPADLSTRWATFSMGEDRLTINQDRFGSDNGVTVSCRYVADANGTATFKMAPLQPVNLSIHVNGFSNRQAVSPYYIPVIVAQPQSQWMTAGMPVNFSVTANAMPAPTYQWRLNGVAITDATTATFALPTTTELDAGDYTVVVANQMGAVTSQVARLTVGLSTVLNSSFEAEAFGTFPGYVSGNGQISGWTALGGHGLNPAAGSPFADNGTTPNGGQVAFMQENGIMSQLVPGFTVGSQYYLHYYENARSGTAPALEVKVGGVVVIPMHIISLVGGANLYYSMFSDVFVAETPELLLEFNKANPLNGDCTVLLDNVAFVEVKPETAPFISREPVSKAVSAGASVTLVGQGIGSLPVSYQWLKNGEPITGATEATLAFNSIQESAEGEYSVRVSNEWGTATSASAKVTVYQPIAGLFSTGVDNSGVAMASGAVDAHYQLIENPDVSSTDTIVEGLLPGAWMQYNSTSGWIGPKMDTVGSAVGNYTYRLVLDLKDRDPKTVVIEGRWATDNTGTDIRVNGTSLGMRNTTQFPSWTSFAIYGSNVTFVAGENTLDFVVANEGAIGYTGLRVEIDKSDADFLPGSMPEISAQPTFKVSNWAFSPAAVGDTITFTAAARGASPLSFQWKKDGVAIDGQTSLTLTLASAVATDSGAYTLEVSNPAGTVVSDPVDLCVCSEVIPGIFGTGVDEDGNVLAEDGAVDPHFVLTVSADLTYTGPDAIAINNLWPVAPAGPWVANGPNSRWIGPWANQNDAPTSGGGSAAGDYHFATEFDLSAYDIDQVTIIGAFAADNTLADVLVNGEPTGITGAGFGGLMPLTLTAANGLTAGYNSMTFVLNNADNATHVPNPAGLRVDMRGLVAIERIAKAKLTITTSGNNVSVSWAPVAEGQVLQSAPTVNGPWSDVSNAGNPYTTTASGMKFFRVVKP